MGCETWRDPVQGYAAKVDSSGNVQTKVNGSVDVGSTSGTVATKPAAWSATSQHGASVGTTATKICDSAAGRVYLRLTNNGAVDVFLFTSSEVTTDDTKLAPGASMEFQGGYAGEWWGITSTSSARVAAVEMTA